MDSRMVLRNWNDETCRVEITQMNRKQVGLACALLLVSMVNSLQAFSQTSHTALGITFRTS